MDNDVLRRLMWAGMVAATGALASVVANRIAVALWVRSWRRETALKELQHRDERTSSRPAEKSAKKTGK